jgi:hypothetical protein
MDSLSGETSDPQPTTPRSRNFRLTHSNTLVNLNSSSLNHSLSPQPPPPKKHKPLVTPPIYSPGELGKLARQYACRLARLGWPRFFQQHHHHSIKSTSPTLHQLPHPAAPLLARLARQGVPAIMTSAPWTTRQQDAMANRGPHPSAQRVHTNFLLEDMYNMVHMGYWVVLPYSSLRGHPHLKLAPSGVVPQRERRPRPIMDYTYNGVNQATVDMAPQHAMQFGHALQRLLQRLAYCNPAHGPPLMAKIDLADGYYRIPLSQHAALALAVVLPSDGLSEPLIGLPLSLPMGWKDSPPFFCAFTETCADIVNSNVPTQPHPFASVLPTDTTLRPPTFSPHAIFPFHPYTPTTPHLSYTDVYLDDFMQLVQHPYQHPAMNSLLSAINRVFCDPATSPRKAIVSQSKVEKGDATFSTTKRLLGWDIDSASLTLNLPSHRSKRLLDCLDLFLTRRHATRKQWQKLLGELRSATLALHSSTYLFSILQTPLTKPARRFRLSSILKLALQDWKHLIQHISHHPVHITSIVPHAPHYVTSVDASRTGMGGWWLPTILTEDSQPCIWRCPFPTNIQNTLCTVTNPSGALCNSDLELAAAILGQSTLLHNTTSLPYTHTLLGTDNSATQAWIKNGSISTTAAPAHLLRQLALTSRHHDACLTATHVAGDTNHIADLLSRSFHLSDSQLLHLVQRTWPVKPRWRLVTPQATLVSALNSALLRRLPGSGSAHPAWKATIHHGTLGWNSAIPSTKTPGYNTLTTPCRSCRSMLRDTAWETLLPPALQSKLGQWRQPFVPWDRLSPHWDIKIPALHPTAVVNSTSDCTDNYRPTKKQTHLHIGSNRSHYKSFNMPSIFALEPQRHSPAPSRRC